MTLWMRVKGQDLKRLSYEMMHGLIPTKKQEAYIKSIEVNNESIKYTYTQVVIVGKC